MGRKSNFTVKKPEKHYFRQVMVKVNIGSSRGTWVAQSVGQPTTAQVTISQSVGSSPASGSVLTAQSLEPGSNSVSLSLSLPLPCLLSVIINIKNFFFNIGSSKLNYAINPRCEVMKMALYLCDLLPPKPIILF